MYRTKMDDGYARNTVNWEDDLDAAESMAYYIWHPETNKPYAF